MDTEETIPTIHHVESLRRKPSYYWATNDHSYVEVGATHYQGNVPTGFCFRPALNLRTLIPLLSPEEREQSEPAEEESGESSTSGCTTGKRKRSASPHPPSKRARLDEDEFDRGSELDEEEEEVRSIEDYDDYVHPQYRQIYPSYWDSCTDVIDNVEERENTTFLQVYRWNLSLRYTKAYEDDDDDYVNDKYAKKWGWLKEEHKFISLLEARAKVASLPQVIDIGRFYMARYCDRYVALPRKFERPHNFSPETIKELSERWLLLLPDIPWPDGMTAEKLARYDMQPTGGHRDFITACAVFQSESRAKLEANLGLHILQPGTYDPTCELPFELRAHFSFSLAIPEIYRPFANSYSQRESDRLEGLQLRLISFLSQSPLTHLARASTGDEATDVTIPFFLSIMRPAPPLPPGVTYESLQPDGLRATLLPFQRRTVAWMLEREGKRITHEGAVVPLVDTVPSNPDVGSSLSSQSQPLPVFWEKIEMGGQSFFFNRFTSAVSPSLPAPHPALGGILAEEPGLGKTMECIGLMLLNPAPDRNPSNKRWDPEAQLHVKEIKTTLIVTPPALAPQWADELAAHAPDLKVFVYEGWAKVGVPITEADVEVERERRIAAENRRLKVNGSKANSKRNGKSKAKASVDEDIEMAPSPDNPILDWPNFINQFDVCITTYNALRSDITVARAPPKRPRRRDVEYKNLERPRSPLVMCEWYRVIMDEVQMMGTGRSEEMVSLIPRLSSFAVSGTPARTQVSDLIRVLRFLRVDDLVAPMRMWNRLLKHGYKDQFVAFFEKYSVRTLKSSVKDELTIPHQQRYLVSIDLGRVERHVYDQALEESLAELGLDARGVAAYEGWEVDTGVLRNVLRRLRGICTHPQVGQPRQDKLFKPGALKSMAEVLEAMRDQNWRNLMEDRRAKVLALTRLARLQQHQSENLDRYQRALERFLTAETEVNQLIDEVKAAIAQHNVKGDALKKGAQALRDSRKINVPEGHTEKSTDKGKGKEVDGDAMAPDIDFDEDVDAEDRGLPKTPAGEEHRIKRIALLARLRECLLVLHRVKFLQGDVYHVLGSSFTEKEDAAYGDAESMRKDLLRSTEDTASRAMRRLSANATEKKVTEEALQIALPFLSGGGIRSTHLFDEANELIENVLNEQTTLLWEWRSKIVELLSQKLNSAGEQADGEEYSRTLDIQGEAEVYLQAYASLLADRREAIAAERTLLAAHEGREKKRRKTKAALAAGRSQDRDEDNLEIPEDIEVLPEHEVLHKELLEKCKELQIEGRALKSVMVDLSAVAVRVAKDTDPEKIIAKDGATMLRTLIAAQTELMDKMDADLAQLRKVFNDRIVYFRQLQEISDTVMEVAWEGRVVDAIEAASKDYVDLGNQINAGRARQRYLDYLAKGGETGTDEEDAECILCQCEFSRGFITQCAHVFCEGCMKLWIARGQGRACPVCRSPIDPNQLQRFAIQDDQPAPSRPTLADGEPVPVSHREIQYNMIDPALFADIQTMESNGSYGCKIQTLIRHLLHIQIVDPGAKSIIFSAWADSLTIIEHALLANRIPCLRLDHNQGKGRLSGAKRFRLDLQLQVLLLHGERDNAGLNVTCASRVFLVESVVNHGFEVQAIARIDRMGQTRPTEVFCYYAEETVEKNILDLAARQGLSLYTKNNSGGSLNVTSFAMDSQKKLIDAPTKSKKGQPAQKGDFIFKVNDMLAILFPHMFEDIEFLLPPDAEPESSTNSQPGNPRPPARRTHVNAEAGPSRISA